MKYSHLKPSALLLALFALLALAGCDNSGDTSDHGLVDGNKAPVADAGIDQHIKIKSSDNAGTVFLDASASSDADHDPLTYSWSIQDTPAGSTATLSDPTSSHPDFIADVDGIYGVELIVSDGKVNSTAITVTITARAQRVNSNPVANAGVDQHIKTKNIYYSGRVVLDASASSDADHNPLTYVWSIQSTPERSSATLNDPTLSRPEFIADIDGTYVVELTVNDGEDDSTAVTVTINAQTDNSNPIADAGADQHVKTKSTANAGTVSLVAAASFNARSASLATATSFNAGKVFLAAAESSDADHDLLTYAWNIQSAPAGSAATLNDPTSSHPEFIADADGFYVVKLRVNDGAVDSTTATVTINAQTDNSAPAADAGRDQNVKGHGILQVTLDGSASSDADHDLLTYAWNIQSAPAGSTAILNDPTSSHPEFIADVDGFYVVKLTVNDGTVISTTATVTINAQTTNLAPVADAGKDKNVKVHKTLQVTLDGSASSDADHDVITYAWSLQSKPTGSSATLADANTSAPSFVADADGNYVVKLIVNDSFVNSTTATVTINAQTFNATPVANAGKEKHVKVHNTLQVTLAGSASSDADHDLLTYAWSLQSKPTGSNATLAHANISAPSFVADADGNYVVKLIVNDGVVDSDPVTVMVEAQTQNSKPVANAGVNQTVMTGDTVILDGIQSSDADSDPLTYTWHILSVAAGSNATLSGTNTSAPSFVADADGEYVVKLIVSDGIENSTEATVTVKASSWPDNLTITNALLQKVVASTFDNTPYNPAINIQGVIGSGGMTVAVPYTVINAAATLPGYATSVTLDASTTQNNESGIKATFAWAKQTDLPVGSGFFTATITIDDSAGNNPDGVYNAKKLDIDAAATGGLMVSTFPYPLSSTGATAGLLTLKIMPGIPDRMFGKPDNTGNDRTHEFLYVPVTNASTGKTWLSTNLGAHYSDINNPAFSITQQAKTFDDYHAYGSFFQWGRKADGHDLITWTNGTTAVGTYGFTDIRSDNPDHALFIIVPNSPYYDWRKSTIVDDSLWASESSPNNVCPAGYRVPTKDEVLEEKGTWNPEGHVGALTGTLAVPNAGDRWHIEGTKFNEVSHYSRLHTSTVNTSRLGGTEVYYLSTFSDSSSVYSNSRAWGASVRCLKD